MKDIYRDFCRLCILKGNVSEPVKICGCEIKYVDCQRDNEDVKQNFLRTLNKEDAFLWALQNVELLHCPYLDEEFVKQMNVGTFEMPKPAGSTKED